MFIQCKLEHMMSHLLQRSMNLHILYESQKDST